MLQVDPPEGCGPPPQPTETAPEWLLVVRAVLSRERTALAVSVIAVAVAALVIVVIPVITGQMG